MSIFVYLVIFKLCISLIKLFTTLPNINAITVHVNVITLYGILKSGLPILVLLLPKYFTLPPPNTLTGLPIRINEIRMHTQVQILCLRQVDNHCNATMISQIQTSLPHTQHYS